MRQTERSGEVPVIARVAGLPADAVRRLGTTLCDALPEMSRLEAELARARAELADLLHPLVPGAEPALRRLILAVRRDCFNARPLARHLRGPEWPALRAAAGPLADETAALEEALGRHRESWCTAYGREAARQRLVLAEPLNDAAFLRGLALASPDLFRAARRLAGPDAPAGRSARKAEANLLRYVSRAAVKLSPFSTFTRIGLGALRGGLPRGTARVVGERWRARSLVRVRPYLLDRYGHLLRMHPPFRATLRVVVNNSATEIAPGRFIYLRPSYWEPDEAAAKYSYRPESLVRVGLRGPLVEALRERLAGGRTTYAGLLAALEESAPDAGAAEIREQVDALVRIGFLVLLLPWRVQENHHEAGMLRALRAAALPGTEEVVERLQRLVAAERGYAAAPDPTAGVAAMERLIDEVWEAAAPMVGVDSATGYARAATHSIYEDVFVRAEGCGSEAGEVVQIDRRSAEDALRSVEPLVRLTRVYDHRHDFLFALGELARERFPGRAEVPLLELFDQAQPLWREYVAFRMEARAEDGWRRTWNPLGRPEMEALAGWRAALWNELPGFMRRRDGVQHLDGEALARRLDEVPAGYASAEGGACMFVQPCDEAGKLWMLNRVKEGTGRFGSRFTPVMDPASRRAYTRHMAARGRREVDGEPVELLDLRCVQGDTLNVHFLQTPRVLTLPGAEGEAPPRRQVRLGDLRVRFGAGTPPQLRDARGRRYETAQLGFAFEDYLPTLIKFLCLFGPSEMAAVFPPQWDDPTGGVMVRHRTCLGNVILHRTSWTFHTAPVAAAVAGKDEAGGFAALTRWRRELGIPDHAFLVETVPHPRMGERSQPQYLDFTSPLFMGLFRAALESGAPSLTVVEALPAPGAFPRDGAGRQWAVEVLLDSLALRPQGPRRNRRRIRAAAGHA